jgi:hypothetical protein
MYWHLAGEPAVRRASNREAIGHFRQALALNEKQPLVWSAHASSLKSYLNSARTHVRPWLPGPGGWHCLRACGSFSATTRKLRRLGPTGLWLFPTSRGQFSRADATVNELVNVTRTLDDPDIRLQAQHSAWPTRWFQGALTDAIGHVDAAWNLYDDLRHVRHRFLYLGHDPVVCALSIGAVLRRLLGHPAQGMRLERDAIDLARRFYMYRHWLTHYGLCAWRKSRVMMLLWRRIPRRSC